MWDNFFSWTFCAHPSVRILLVYIFLSARFANLNWPSTPCVPSCTRTAPSQRCHSVSQEKLHPPAPVHDHHAFPPYCQSTGISPGQRLASSSPETLHPHAPVYDNCAFLPICRRKHREQQTTASVCDFHTSSTRIHYTRTELLSISPSRPTRDVTSQLRSLGLGVSLPRKRYPRKKRSQPNSSDTATSSCVSPTSPSSHELLQFLPSCPTPLGSRNLLSPSTAPCLPDSPTPVLPSNSPLPTTNFTACLFNAQSICRDGKIDCISDFIFENNFDLVFLTETWFKSSGHEPKIKQLTPPGYKLRSFPRPSLGGGIAVLYRDVLESCLTFSHSFPFPTLSFEIAEVVLCMSGQSVFFSCVYRPPPNRKNRLTPSMFHDEFQSLLEHYTLKQGKLVILGDVNVHFDDQNHWETKRLCHSLSNHSLSQLVAEPTHKKGHIIDWLIVRDTDDLVTSVSVKGKLPSDHSAILFSLGLSKPKRQKRSVTCRNLKSINIKTFSSEAVDYLSTEPHPPDLASHYNTVLRELLDKHAPPTTRVLPDRPSAPWYTPEIRKAKQARRRVERRWRSTKLVVDSQIHEEHEKNVNKMISKAKTDYFSTQVLESTSTKRLYSVMSDLLGTTKSSPLPSNISPPDLPEAFSTFFSSKVNDIRAKLDQTTFQPSLPDPFFIGSPLTEFQPVSETQIASILKEMSFKSCELDPIPASLFCQILPDLLPFITDIINTSLLTGSVPPSFKTAIVRPLLKKNNLDPNTLKNYRPVSNLQFISKLLEKVVLKQLNSHLSANNLFNPFQSAYRPDHSTETALTHIVNDLLLSTDSGQISLLTLLDLSAAFDTIDHAILLSRLEHTFGIQGTALSWFLSYLSDRFQSVIVNGFKSEPVKVTFGVPQGSVLGPVLFTLYTSPLVSVISQYNIKHHSYADDTQLQNSTTPDNLTALLSEASDCYFDIQNWMTQNKLQLNGDKTEAMLVGTKKTLSTITIHSIQLGDNTIPLSDSAKNLGVVLDSTLSMQKFITQTCQSCYCQLRRISSIRRYLSTDAASKLVTSLILSRLDYCNSLLSGLPTSSINSLQRIQNSAARLVLRKKKCDHVTPLLQSLHWLPVSERISYKINTLCFKCINASAPTYLCDHLQVYTPARPLRSALDTLSLQIPRYRYSTVGRRSFSVSGPYTWNDLPLTLRQTQTLSSFKSQLKTHLFPQQ